MKMRTLITARDYNYCPEEKWDVLLECCDRCACIKDRKMVVLMLNKAGRLVCIGAVGFLRTN